MKKKLLTCLLCLFAYMTNGQTFDAKSFYKIYNDRGEVMDNGDSMDNSANIILGRGTLDCAAFPKTGYPPTDQASCEKIFTACRNHGLNHIRFHSWCPPEAAFCAADKMGMYLEIECSSWASSTHTGAVPCPGKSYKPNNWNPPKSLVRRAASMSAL